MDVGQTVAASFQAPVIFLIAQDLTKMQVDTNVDEADVGPVRVGQTATFTVDAYPGQVFRGSVAQIREAPINVQNVITYDVVIAVSNPDLKLFPGMTANATIFTGHVSNAVRIPKAALRFRPRPDTVYVADENGQPKAVKIRTGIGDANHVEMLSGDLTPGERLITGTAGRSPGAGNSPSGTSGAKKLGF
jgi:HlyD family secretion protein